jgi:hypothetical protein
MVYETARAFGDVFVLHELWKDLGFDRALATALRSGRREIDVEALDRAMVGLQLALRARQQAWLPALAGNGGDARRARRDCVFRGHPATVSESIRPACDVMLRGDL